MHANSMRLMKRMRSEFIAPRSRVLDVGGANINGTYRSLFSDCEYLTLDMAGDDVDIRVDGYDWPLDDKSFDAVISGQAFEHDKFFWVTMKNIARVLRPGGPFLLVLPAIWHVHRYPVDCWRFLPDGLAALAEWGGFDLLWSTYDDSASKQLVDVAAAMRRHSSQ